MVWSLKSFLCARLTSECWVDDLSWVLLDIWTTPKLDLECSPSDLVLCYSPQLPGELLQCDPPPHLVRPVHTSIHSPHDPALLPVCMPSSLTHSMGCFNLPTEDLSRLSVVQTRLWNFWFVESRPLFLLIIVSQHFCLIPFILILLLLPVLDACRVQSLALICKHYSSSCGHFSSVVLSMLGGDEDVVTRFSCSHISVPLITCFSVTWALSFPFLLMLLFLYYSPVNVMSLASHLPLSYISTLQ